MLSGDISPAESSPGVLLDETKQNGQTRDVIDTSLPVFEQTDINRGGAGGGEGWEGCRQNAENLPVDNFQTPVHVFSLLSRLRELVNDALEINDHVFAQSIVDSDGRTFRINQL